VNSLAQAAAIAALNDDEFQVKSFAVNRDGKAQLQHAFENLGLKYVPSFANFVLVHVDDAPRINLELLKRGVIVRPVAGDGLPQCLRVSIGLREENQKFIDALTAILAATDA
jgi:histidinol-phosphate aminotransferase